MNARFSIVAVFALLAAGAADAALHCKNDLGQALLWQVNQARPDTTPGAFDISGPRQVVCIVSSYAYFQLLPQITGIPNIAGIPSEGVNGDGIIYRGDLARFLIENLPATNSRPATKAQYDAAKP